MHASQLVRILGLAIHMQPITTTSSAVLDGQGNEDDDTLGHRQVGAFLTKCDLQRYYSTFIDEGFDQLEAVSISYDKIKDMDLYIKFDSCLK